MDFKELFLGNADIKTIQASIIGSMISLIIFYLFVTSIFGLGYLFKDFHEKELSKDEVVDIVSELCSSHNLKLAKAKCIVDFYNNHYEYEIRENPYINIDIKTSTEFIREKAMCIDFALNVCVALEKSGIKCSYGRSERHIFPIFNMDQNFYCIFDLEYKCRINNQYPLSIQEQKLLKKMGVTKW